MEPFVTKLQGSGEQLVKQGDALLARTREAGLAFASETRDASLAFAEFVRGEAKRWARYVKIRATRVEDDAKKLWEQPKLAQIERGVLSQADEAISLLHAKVQARLASLEKRKAKRRAINGTGRAALPAARKAKSNAAKAKGGSGLSLAGVRH